MTLDVKILLPGALIHTDVVDTVLEIGTANVMIYFMISQAENNRI